MHWIAGMNEQDRHKYDDIQILVVDDEDVIRDTVYHAMAYAGYTCLTARDGHDALAILEDHHVDVVITDIQMPNLNGIELTKIIKEKYDSNVIMMTGFVRDYRYEEIIEEGASDFIQKPVSIKELIMRVKRVLRERTLVRERNIMIEALQESEKKYQELSITDDLTNLFNSRYFYNKLSYEINRANRYNHPLTILLFDVDNFKKYNDTFGHLEGDKVLIRLADIIRGCIRCTDSAYRYGGEEFVVVLPETKGEKGLIVAERIRQGFKNITFIPEEGKAEQVTVSIGVAEYLPDEALEEFIKRADQRMYRAKQRGKDQCFFIGADAE